jgi:hypothetical protein
MSMRRLALFLSLVAAVPSFAQAYPGPSTQAVVAQRPPTTPAGPRCCEARVYDGAGKTFGEVITWDASQLETVSMRYTLADGSSVALIVSGDYVRSLLQPGGSNVLFLTADCSGDAFVIPAKMLVIERQSVVLMSGSNMLQYATSAWLYASAPLATRVMPAPGTIFKSQWDMNNCVAYPAPGYTYSGSPFGGFWMKRIENLYAKWKRPFWTK